MEVNARLAPNKRPNTPVPQPSRNIPTFDSLIQQSNHWLWWYLFRIDCWQISQWVERVETFRRIRYLGFSVSSFSSLCSINNSVWSMLSVSLSSRQFCPHDPMMLNGASFLTYKCNTNQITCSGVHRQLMTYPIETGNWSEHTYSKN